jgi:hypothetical protein
LIQLHGDLSVRSFSNSQNRMHSWGWEAQSIIDLIKFRCYLIYHFHHSILSLMNLRFQKHSWRLSMMVHACNPSYLWGGDIEIVVWGQPQQKVSETPSQSIRWCAVTHLSF